MSGTFSFCPNSIVVENLAPDAGKVMSMNGWAFTAKPTIPFVNTFKVTLHGLRWILLANGLYDTVTTPTINARGLELFYQANGLWDTFSFTHPHITGALTCRFAEKVTVPAARENGNGYCNPVEVMLLHHNPGY